MSPMSDTSVRIAELLAQLLPGGQVGSFVGGEVLPGTGAGLELTNPADGQVFL